MRIAASPHYRDAGQSGLAITVQIPFDAPDSVIVIAPSGIAIALYTVTVLSPATAPLQPRLNSMPLTRVATNGATTGKSASSLAMLPQSNNVQFATVVALPSDHVMLPEPE